MISRSERLQGAIYGLLIGDALGVPYEFDRPEDIPPPEEIEFTPPANFRRAHAGLPPGTWSDDGAQALILLASLLDQGKLDLVDFSQRLVAWYQKGYMAVDEDVFDVGIQTSQAIQRLMNGVAPERAGSKAESDNGNGSLMRVLPLALWHTGSDAELVDAAQQQSRVTHGHLRSQVCCALYCLWARAVLQEQPDPWASAAASLRQVYGTRSPERSELEYRVRPEAEPHGQGSGYVLDCLHSARMVMQAGSYEQVVRAAIRLGNDTDTTACVAGGIAGLRDGIHAIPERWRTNLRGQDLVAPLVARLVG